VKPEVAASNASSQRSGKPRVDSNRNINIHVEKGKLCNTQGQVEERVNADGSVLRGEFRNGEIYNGSGVLLFPNGNTFEGT